MRDFVENEVGSLRDHGAPGISWALLVLCFALAFSPAPQPAGDRAASGSAEVEVETGPEMPVVALTFDDGPRAATTGRLLDELALREVPATFFLLGTAFRATRSWSAAWPGRVIRSASTPSTTSR